MAMQPALFHGSGEFPALVLLKRKSGAEIVPSAAKLLALTRLQQVPEADYPGNLHVLVALKPTLLGESLPQASAFAPPDRFKDEPADVLVQISAATAADRVFALRLVADCFAGIADARCLQGARLLNSQESFGFRDGAAISPAQVAERIGGAPEGTWLLFQRIKQHVREFLSLDEAAKVAVVGRAPTNSFGHPPATQEELKTRADLMAAAADARTHAHAHYHLMREKPVPMVRRGFSYQNFDDEGLAFVAAAATPQTFSEALTRMSGGDKLLPYMTVLEGGLYFCPSLEWLAPSMDAGELPATALPLRHGTPLISYTTTEAFVRWMLEMRERGLFRPGPPGLSSQLSGDLQPLMDEMYALMPGTTSDPQLLKSLQRQAESDAAAINETLDDYLTFN